MTTQVNLSGTLQDLPRSGLLLEELVAFPIDLQSLGVWDATNFTHLGAAGNDDLGFVQGTWASASPMIKSITSSGTTVLEYARFRVLLPECYVAAGRVQLKFHSRVEVQADVSATLDLVAFESNGEGGIGSDLCTTDAQSINSTSWADKTFELTATGLIVADVLDCRIAVSLDDTGGSNACIANIGKISLLCHIRG